MQYEDIRQALAAKFDQLETTLEELRSKVREKTHESRATWESQLAELERQRRAARASLATFSSESVEVWKTFKTGMDATWQSLKTACDDARQQLGSGPAARK